MYVTVNEWRVCVVSSCPVFPHFCAFIRLVGKVERLTVSRSDGSTLAAVPPIRRRGKRKPSWWSGITRESVAKRSVHSEKSRQDTMSPHSTILYRPLHLSTFHVGHAWLTILSSSIHADCSEGLTAKEQEKKVICVFYVHIWTIIIVKNLKDSSSLQVDSRVSIRFF